jgi:hypothetical protein
MSDVPQSSSLDGHVDDHSRRAVLGTICQAQHNEVSPDVGGAASGGVRHERDSSRYFHARVLGLVYDALGNRRPMSYRNFWETLRPATR